MAHKKKKKKSFKIHQSRQLEQLREQHRLQCAQNDELESQNGQLITQREFLLEKVAEAQADLETTEQEARARMTEDVGGTLSYFRRLLLLF
jgi:hypothetical protein